MTNKDPMGNRRVSDLRLWLASFMPVIAWALQLFASYGFVELYCRQLREMSQGTALGILYAITFAALGLTAAGGVMSFQNRRIIDLNDAQKRGRFVANGGILLALFMTALILVQGLPNLLVAPCI